MLSVMIVSSRMLWVLVPELGPAPGLFWLLLGASPVETRR